MSPICCACATPVRAQGSGGGAGPVGRASFKLALLLIRVPVPRAAPHAFICDPLAPPSGLSVELQGDVLTGQRKDQPRKDTSSHPVREGKKGMEGCGR